jgi:hypothetical protein
VLVVEDEHADAARLPVTAGGEDRTSRGSSSLPHLPNDRLEVAGRTAAEEGNRDVQVACPDGPNGLRTPELALLPCAKRPDGVVGQAESDKEAQAITCMHASA